MRRSYNIKKGSTIFIKRLNIKKVLQKKKTKRVTEKYAIKSIKLKWQI